MKVTASASPRSQVRQVSSAVGRPCLLPVRRLSAPRGSRGSSAARCTARTRWRFRSCQTCRQQTMLLLLLLEGPPPVSALCSSGASLHRGQRQRQRHRLSPAPRLPGSPSLHPAHPTPVFARPPHPLPPRPPRALRWATLRHHRPSPAAASVPHIPHRSSPPPPPALRRTLPASASASQ